jgi:tRNA threonylcarbamoyladenosine biosynthesis protein TsaE
MLSHSEKETLKSGRSLAKKLKPGDIICLFGDLGAGKTVFTKGIAEGLGIKRGRIISPTFVIIREHSSGRLPLYHFDLYRLNDPEDILRLGYEEYLYNQGVSVIEWADRLKYLLPEKYLKVELTVKSPTKRSIKISKIQ